MSNKLNKIPLMLQQGTGSSWNSSTHDTANKSLAPPLKTLRRNPREGRNGTTTRVETMLSKRPDVVLVRRLQNCLVLIEFQWPFTTHDPEQEQLLLFANIAHTSPFTRPLFLPHSSPSTPHHDNQWIIYGTKSFRRPTLLSPSPRRTHTHVPNFN